ncbi:hypothetical protein MMC25_002377 [Agyrium rufum]|nr:hypothetical protein [Agyrium rufum]
MDKLKNILNPGGKADDEVLYGTGQSSDPVHSGTSETGQTGSLTGEGSHLSKASHNPTTAGTGSSTTSGYPDTTSSINPTSALSSNDPYSTSGTGPTGASSQLPGGFADEDASTTAIRGGVLGDNNLAQGNDSFGSNKPLPAEPQTGNQRSHLGRDAGLAGAGGLAAGEALHHHNQNDNSLGQTSQSGQAGERSFPLGGSGTSDQQYDPQSTGSGLTSTHQPIERSDNSHLGRDAGIAGTGLAGAEAVHHHHGQQQQDTSLGSDVRDPYGPESWTHEHNKHGHEFVPVSEHQTRAGALLDPHAESTARAGATAAFAKHQQGQPTTGEVPSGLDSTSGSYPDRTKDSHKGRDVALGGSALAGAGAAYEGHEHGKHAPTGQTGTTADEDLTGPVHKSGLMNKLDPRVKSVSEATPSGTSEYAQSSNPYSSTPVDPRLDSEGKSSKDHHYGRDATAAGALGAGAYEAEKHHHRDEATPRTSGLTGTTANTQAPISTSEQQPSDHHYGRDATLAGGVGAAGYEAEKHHHRDQDPTIASTGPTSTTGPTTSATGTTAPTQDTSSHHYGRDAAGAGALGGAAYEAEKHHNRNELDSSSGLNVINEPVVVHDPLDHGYGRSGAVPHGSFASNKPNPGATTGTSTTQGPRDHHFGRDAALAGGAGAVGAHELSKKDEKKLEKEEIKHEKKLEKEEAKHEKELAKEEKHYEKDEKKHHKEEAAAAGVVGAGGLAAAEHHHHGKDQLGDPAHNGAVPDKTHQKLDKQLEKSQAKQEKEFHKHHDKDAVAYEQSGPEKEHKGLLGRIFHRNKGDKDDTTTTTHDHHRAEEAAVAGGAVGAAGFAEKEHRDHSGPSQGYESSPVTSGIPEAELEKRSVARTGLSGAKGADTGIVAPSAVMMTEHERAQHAKNERERMAPIAQTEEEQELERRSRARVTLAGAKGADTTIVPPSATDMTADERAFHERSERERLAPSAQTEEERELELRGHAHPALSGAKGAEMGIVPPSATGMTDYERQNHEKNERDRRERNRLHKDPPASVQREMEQQREMERAGPASTTTGNTLGGNQIQYAEAPTKGYASQVTGGTGSTGLAQGDPIQRGSHLTDAGNVLNPTIDDRGVTRHE